MLSRISGEQCADYSRHPPFWNRSAAEPQLRSSHQLFYLAARLRMESWCGPRDVRNPRHVNLFDIRRISVLEKDHRRVHILGELLAADGHSARVLESPEQKQLLFIENGDAGSVRIDFYNQRSLITCGSAKSGQHRRKNH